MDLSSGCTDGRQGRPVRGLLESFERVAFPDGARVLVLGHTKDWTQARTTSDLVESYNPDSGADAPQSEAAQHPQLLKRLHEGPLSALPPATNLGGPFDGLMWSAAPPELTRVNVFDLAFAMKALLVVRGRALVSLPSGNQVGPDELELFFERVGFSSVGRWIASSGPDGCLTILLFELRTGNAHRPLDRIEALLSHSERKVATYKLALIRALCDVAQTQSRTAQWLDNGQVAIPIEAVAERWVLYYWPLFESRPFLPQMNGERGSHQLGFARELNSLIRAYDGLGSLDAYAVDRRRRSLPPDREGLRRRLITRLKHVIVAGPVTYARGGGETRMFDRRGGHVLVDARLWRELVLMGHWIQDSLVLRWAELIHRLSRKEVPVHVAVAALVVAPTEERETKDARDLFVRVKDLRCVWTDTPLQSHVLEIDHLLPYSLWRNNDLWNLLPAARRVNQEKSDKLPTRDLLLKRRDAITYCWMLAQNAHKRRFVAEVAGLSGRQEQPVNLGELFQVVTEAVETTALQRGCERWEP